MREIDLAAAGCFDLDMAIFFLAATGCFGKDIWNLF